MALPQHRVTSGLRRPGCPSAGLSAARAVRSQAGERIRLATSRKREIKAQRRGRAVCSASEVQPACLWAREEAEPQRPAHDSFGACQWAVIHFYFQSSSFCLMIFEIFTSFAMTCRWLCHLVPAVCLTYPLQSRGPHRPAKPPAQDLCLGHVCSSRTCPWRQQVNHPTLTTVGFRRYWAPVMVNVVPALLVLLYSV